MSQARGLSSLALLLGFTCAAVLAQSGESVTVQKVMDDQAVLIRSNGDVYLVEKGVGCLSLWRKEGKRVVVSSPGSFLGIGSKLVIPDLEQECRIWESKLIESSPSTRPDERSPSVPGRGAAGVIDEFSLYDSRGRASAFLDVGDQLTFFLWSGEPVAYLADESVYGFNGKHLGWYRSGTVFDHDGAVVVAPASAFSTDVAPAPPRGLKQLKPLKGLKELKPLRPLFGRSWSELPARVFFMMGAN